MSTLLLGLYIALAPFAPELSLSLNPISKSLQAFFGQDDKLNNIVIESETKKEEEIIPTENKLVIPKIDVDGQVYEGTSVATLEKGIWHRPKTSTPDKGGNTVFVAHRFLYTSGPNTFYHLNKLKVDDEFTIYWDKKKYSYKVFEVSVVSPTTYNIEYPTKDSIVTLWTCTPLFTATNRLVVKAKLVNPI